MSSFFSKMSATCVDLQYGPQLVSQYLVASPVPMAKRNEAMVKCVNRNSLPARKERTPVQARRGVTACRHHRPDMVLPTLFLTVPWTEDDDSIFWSKQNSNGSKEFAFVSRENSWTLYLLQSSAGLEPHLQLSLTECASRSNRHSGLTPREF